MQQVKKAIIPMGGYGTRLLPATKAQPKEMLVLVDKPVVQYLVEEAVEAGIETIIFVINTNKHIVGDHFGRNLELEQFLKDKGKDDLLAKIQNIHKQAEFLYVHQNEPLGSGDAILRGQSMIGDEPFAIFYADDVLDTEPGNPAIGQLIKTYDKHGVSTMGLMEVPKEDAPLYGMIKGEQMDDRTYKVHDVVEKPSVAEAPSSLASVGRFVITPEVFERIPHLKERNGEIYFADALAEFAGEGKLYGHKLDATWYDCGSKKGFYKATVELGKKHPEIGEYAKKL